MNLTDMVIMPGDHYQDACNAIREKTGGTNLIRSGEMGAQIRSISTGVELPELTDPASASDIAEGKEAIDGEGNVLTGTAASSIPPKYGTVRTEADSPTITIPDVGTEYNKILLFCTGCSGFTLESLVAAGQYYRFLSTNGDFHYTGSIYNGGVNIGLTIPALDALVPVMVPLTDVNYEVAFNADGSVTFTNHESYQVYPAGGYMWMAWKE